MASQGIGGGYISTTGKGAYSHIMRKYNEFYDTYSGMLGKCLGGLESIQEYWL